MEFVERDCDGGGGIPVLTLRTEQDSDDDSDRDWENARNLITGRLSALRLVGRGTSSSGTPSTPPVMFVDREIDDADIESDGSDAEQGISEENFHLYYDFLDSLVQHPDKVDTEMLLTLVDLQDELSITEEDHERALEAVGCSAEDFRDFVSAVCDEDGFDEKKKRKKKKKKKAKSARFGAAARASALTTAIAESREKRARTVDAIMNKIDAKKGAGTTKTSESKEATSEERARIESKLSPMLKPVVLPGSTHLSHYNTQSVVDDVHHQNKKDEMHLDIARSKSSKADDRAPKSAKRLSVTLPKGGIKKFFNFLSKKKSSGSFDEEDETASKQSTKELKRIKSDSSEISVCINETEAADSDILLEGWLFKYNPSALRKGWYRKWFVLLKNMQLIRYEHQKMSAGKAMDLLTHTFHRANVSGYDKAPPHPYCFDLVSERGKTTSLAASSFKESERWILEILKLQSSVGGRSRAATMARDQALRAMSNLGLAVKSNAIGSEAPDAGEADDSGIASSSRTKIKIKRTESWDDDL